MAAHDLVELPEVVDADLGAARPGGFTEALVDVGVVAGSPASELGEKDAARPEHPQKLGCGAPPVGDQVQDVADDGCADRVVAEGQPGGVGRGHREQGGSAGLGDELAQHGEGQVDAEELPVPPGER